MLAVKFLLSFVVFFLLAAVLDAANNKIKDEEIKQRVWNSFLYPMSVISFFGSFASAIWLIWSGW